MAETKLSPLAQQETAEAKQSSPLPASKEEDTRNSESGNQDSVLALTEANLWMKSVIDAVHEDIQNRNRSKRVEIDAQSLVERETEKRFTRGAESRELFGRYS
ncbi:hypothetical protein L207DRAFT_564430 [Hyaloscypha variabilis F]|uniref:Uncharacterized protein n=1 Tax=Hyaloscypha variabilis (strain UAMH 11265 / GT02V1 / F) TaxID=1149755 RepID=A0A2J6RTZ8_HYAVF|nr:hypothetical protein L207DRAFT_564430 [Hyaloscypha variabilis F]